MRTTKRMAGLLGAMFMLAMMTTGCKTEPTVSCTVLAGQCPNVCGAGSGVQNETCSGSGACGCGLFCDGLSNTCQPYEGDNAGCSCSAPIDGSDVTSEVSAPVDSGPDLSCNGQPAPAGAKCNPYCQIGCEADKQCTYTGSNIECDGSGELAASDVCSNSYECGVGMACFKLNDDPASVCRQFCQKDTDCPADRKCTVNVNFGSGFEARFCSEPTVGCSVFDDQCGDAQGCYYASSATSCMPSGTKLKDEVCHGLGANACVKGLQCLVTCREACSTNAGNDDQPKCSDVCDETKELSAENGLGVCVPDEPPTTCDLYTQEGCGTGEGCYGVTGGFACVTAGAGKPGESCSFGNDCEAGSLCLNGTCAELCSASADDAGKEFHCETKCNDSGTLSPAKWEIGYCKDADPASPCDFWAQDCEGGKTCYATNVGASCMPTGGSVAEGQDCQFIQDCAAGLVCGAGKCRQPCSIADFPEGLCKPIGESAKTCEDVSDCSADQTCTADTWADGTPAFCADACVAAGKDISPVIPGALGYCAE